MPTAVKKPVSTPSVAPFCQFGLEWNGPSRAWSEIQKRRFCARHGRGTVPVYEHRKAIMEALWPDDVYEMNFWSDIRLRGTCEDVFVTWMGPGGVGKTFDAAAIALEYWLEAPHETAVIVCSTSKIMLRRRIWNEICFLWNRLPSSIEDKGVLNDTDLMIRWRDGDKKNGIFGVAVDDGPIEQAVNQIRGIHTTRVWWILDEMQGVEEAIMGVMPNHAKNPEPRFLGMGNPTRLSSMLCRYSEPIGGWSSVVRGETPDWPIDEHVYLGTGRAYFFDGRKSPAVLDPAWGKAHPWMISKEQVDKHIAKKGMNSPEVWTDTIGWPPTMGTDSTVLDVQLIEKFGCREAAIWTNGFQAGWALDPAFEITGDSRILQFFKFGEVNDALGLRWVIELGEWMEVPLDDTPGESEPSEYQILEFVREQCKSRGLGPNDGGTDSSGTGHGLHSTFVQNWGPVRGIEFGGKPSDLPIDETGKRADQVFDRRSSELNIMVRNFANQHGIRGLSRDAEKQFCSRFMLYEGKGRWVVESKRIMINRGEKSPGNADAVAIAVEVARQRGAVPGAPISVQTREEQERVANEMDMAFEEEQILASEFV